MDRGIGTARDVRDGQRHSGRVEQALTATHRIAQHQEDRQVLQLDRCALHRQPGFAPGPIDLVKVG